MPSELLELSTPSLDLLDRFMVAVEEARSARTAGEWREVIRRSRVLREWKHFLALDPYTRWGMVKPCGYAGDATLMDFAYRHPDIQHHIASSGDVGAAIYTRTSTAAQSQSARQRISVARHLLRRRAALGNQRVMSFASGHAREFEGLSSDVLAGISRFTPIDNDPSALQVAKAAAGSVHCTPSRRNVVKEHLSDLPQADTVYSLGLFDYLTEETAVEVLRKMLDRTAPGGVCMIANLARDAANLGYCEAIMDWWMVTRSEHEMLDLVHSATGAQGRYVEATVDRAGCFVYLILRLVCEPACAARHPGLVESTRSAQ